MSQLQGVVLNGPEDVQQHRYPGNVNLSFAYVEGESLIMGLKVRPGAAARTWWWPDLDFASQLLGVALVASALHTPRQMQLCQLQS
jgi:hypothetical protein